MSLVQPLHSLLVTCFPAATVHLHCHIQPLHCHVQQSDAPDVTVLAYLTAAWSRLPEFSYEKHEGQ